MEVPFLTSNQALEFSWATHHYQGIDAASVPLIVFLVTIILVRSVRSGERGAETTAAQVLITLKQFIARLGTHGGVRKVTY